ncbi:MAG TPA: hypothetical protein EYG16_01230 [Deltaproteobacteria bacterium]|nr:hypothetical protein [Candidatus Binatota bacterium]HIL12277.1 hypothetical protein [Deltaproteobacteria bacterium]
MFDEPSGVKAAPSDDESELDAAGRLKIKRQYIELLGIRRDKLAGRILNRERLTKEKEGIYFICIDCKQICHNFDEGLVEDEDNKNNKCTECHKLAQTPKRSPAPRKTSAPKPAPRKSRAGKSSARKATSPRKQS